MDTLIQHYSDLYNHDQKSGNWFGDFNPLSKLNILLVIGLCGFFIQDWRFSLGVCILEYLFAALNGKFKYFNSIFLRLIFIIGVFIILIRELSYKVENPTIMFNLLGWKWTWEAFYEGLRLGTVILSFSGAIILFYAFTTMRDLMYSLEQKGVSHATSYVMLASFQTIIDLRASVVTIMESQKARGIETQGNPLVRLKAFFPIITPLLLGALSSSEEKFVAMDARAFAVERKHTFLRQLRKVPAYEKLAVVAIDAAFAALVLYKLVRLFVH